MARKKGFDVDRRDAKGKTALAIACENRDWKLLTALVAWRAKGLDKDGNLPLHLAVKGYDCGEIEELLRSGYPLDLPNRNGATALHLAVEHYDLTMARTLLAAGADVHARDDSDETPLHLAASAYDGGMVRLLIRSEAELNAENCDGTTPLHMAVAKGNDGIARLLLRAGADPSVSDRVGWTPLTEAADSGNLGLVQALLRAGADPDEGAPLAYAASEGNYPIVRELLRAGADPRGPDSDGNKPLDRSLEGGSDAVFQALWKRAPAHRRELNGLLAKALAEGATPAMVRTLLRAGAYPGEDWDEVDTPLILAVEAGREDLARVLLEAGADVNGASGDGESALLRAVRNGDAEMVALLLGRGADIGQHDSCGDYPGAAASEGFSEKVRSLIENAPAPWGAKPRTPPPDEDGGEGFQLGKGMATGGAQ